MTDLETGAANVPDPNPDRLPFLPIDPFAARAAVASRVAGLGGQEPDDEPDYVFQSLDIYPVAGPVRFTLQFHGLSATSGTLTVRVRALSRHAALPPFPAPMPLAELSVPLCQLAENGGILHLDVENHRNMGCTIGGTIGDATDARAAALSLSLDPRERPTPALPDPAVALIAPPAPPPVGPERPDRPELAVIGTPQLARPVSQAMTEAQTRDPLVAGWNAAVRETGDDVSVRWTNAIILQALRYYGADPEDAQGLGIAPHRHRLPSYLAARGSSVVVAMTAPDQIVDGHPGRTLDAWRYADLCSPRRFAEAVYLTLFEELALPAFREPFDFLWSIDAWRGARDRFAPFTRAAMAALRPGGVAVHILPFAGTLDAPPDRLSFGRVEIERMALTLVADGHEVAQLDFALDQADPRTPRPVTPFALIARRQPLR